jgi:hypothetical protein
MARKTVVAPLARCLALSDLHGTAPIRLAVNAAKPLVPAGEGL